MKILTLGLCALAATAAASVARADAPARQSLDEAWWTGPLLAASAGTLPKGHWLVEPYLYDAVPVARFDADGTRHGLASAHSLGSLTYVNYGVSDRLTVGAIPTFGYALPHEGARSSHIGFGDLSVQAQYRLSTFHPGRWTPTISVNLQETLPTGAYDRLSRPADGFGTGAYKTTLSLYGQTFFWTPNGRILRTRLDLSYAKSGHADVRDLSVYGTTAGFRGRARPGDQAFGDLAFEYSFTQRWVAALDLWYERDASTKLTGAYAPGQGPAAVDARIPASRILYVAPALEYNWSPNYGVIAGARIAAAGRNATATIVPVAAINMVF